MRKKNQCESYTGKEDKKKKRGGEKVVTLQSLHQRTLNADNSLKDSVREMGTGSLIAWKVKRSISVTPSKQGYILVSFSIAFYNCINEIYLALIRSFRV